MRLRVYFLLVLLMTAPVHAEDEKWSALLDKSRAYLQATQAKLERDYRLGEHARWDIDQRTGQIVFSNNGVPAVVANIQFVGSYSTAAKTWLWAWANSSVEPTLVDQMQHVREYGQQHHFAPLVEAKWDGVESDGWDMAAVANFLLRADGVYRPPSGSVIAFVLLTNVRRVDQ
jgi:hypothetical protein